MPSDPTGEAVRNLIRVRRLGNGLAREVRDDIRALIDEFLTELMRVDPTAVSRTRYRRARIEKLLARLKAVAGEHYPEIRKRLEAAVARVGSQQASWAAQTLESAVGDVASVDVALQGVGIQRFRTIMREEPFRGRFLREWFQKHERDTLSLVTQQIRLGMAQDETMDDIVRRIRGRMVGGGPRPTFRGGVMQTSTRDAQAIARTAVNFISNRGHMEAYTANSDVLSGLEFTATLDSRTTQICARWDGTVWDVDDPAKQVPPLHVNCRSVLTPVVDWKSLGVDPPAEGTRASRDGQVRASLTYEDWFRRQSKTEQNEIIGPARAELFRDGKITFRNMIGRDNRVLTLDELDAA